MSNPTPSRIAHLRLELERIKSITSEINRLTSHAESMLEHSLYLFAVKHQMSDYNKGFQKIIGNNEDSTVWCGIYRDRAYPYIGVRIKIAVPAPDPDCPSTDFFFNGSIDCYEANSLETVSDLPDYLIPRLEAEIGRGLEQIRQEISRYIASVQTYHQAIPTTLKDVTR